MCMSGATFGGANVGFIGKGESDRLLVQGMPPNLRKSSENPLEMEQFCPLFIVSHLSHLHLLKNVSEYLISSFFIVSQSVSFFLFYSVSFVSFTPPKYCPKCPIYPPTHPPSCYPEDPSKGLRNLPHGLVLDSPPPPRKAPSGATWHSQLHRK